MNSFKLKTSDTSRSIFYTFFHFIKTHFFRSELLFPLQTAGMHHVNIERYKLNKLYKVLLFFQLQSIVLMQY